MLVTRYASRTTTENLKALVALIEDPGCQRVYLFASPTNYIEGGNPRSDGPDSNLPLVAALAEYDIHGIVDLQIVFDGLFLTAARTPRYSEVQTLLDVAQISNKVFFAKERAAFTSSLEPTDAAKMLGEIAAKGSRQLTAMTRAEYFSMLSTVPESEQI